MMSIDRKTQSKLIETAEAMAEAARVVTLRHFRDSTLAADNKDAAGYDPVTIADRDAERAMRAVLAERRPDDGILGEEFGASEGTSGLTWVLDPVDGTRAFVAGAPTWGVLIALSDATGPLMGVIDQPYIGERFLGGFGRAEMVGPQGARALATRAPRALGEAVLMTTFPEVGSAVEGAAFADLARQVKLTRYGLDCYGYALVASGHVDLVVEASLQPYDIQAPIAVVEAAGGIVTNWQGGPAHHGGRAIAAANREVHAAALEILAKAPA